MKLIRERSTTAALAALVMVGGLSACKSHSDSYATNDTAAVRGDSAAGSMDTTAMTNPAMAAPASVPDSTNASSASTSNSTSNAWSDASIVGYATAANNGEVALGQLAETKATNPAVKAFARRMVADHRAMLAETKSLSTKNNIMGDTTASDARDLMNHGNDELKELTDKAAGADWDKNYMDKAVDDHQKVLSHLQDASKNTTNATLRAALEKAAGKVQMHLTKAKDIEANQLKA